MRPRLHMADRRFRGLSEQPFGVSRKQSKDVGCPHEQQLRLLRNEIARVKIANRAVVLFQCGFLFSHPTA